MKMVLTYTEKETEELTIAMDKIGQALVKQGLLTQEELEDGEEYMTHIMNDKRVQKSKIFSAPHFNGYAESKNGSYRLTFFLDEEYCIVSSQVLGNHSEEALELFQALNHVLQAFKAMAMPFKNLFRNCLKELHEKLDSIDGEHKHAA